MKTPCVFPKIFLKGWEEDATTIYPPWIFFQMCWSNPEGSSKSLAYGILDNLPAPFNGETFRFPPALVKPNTSHHAEVHSLATLRITLGVSALMGFPAKCKEAAPSFEVNSNPPENPTSYPSGMVIGDSGR